MRVGLWLAVGLYMRYCIWFGANAAHFGCRAGGRVVGRVRGRVEGRTGDRAGGRVAAHGSPMLWGVGHWSPCANYSADPNYT